MPKIQMPLDLLGQEIAPGDLVVHILSRGRGVNSRVEVVHDIRPKSVSFRLQNPYFERSIKVIKVTEEQARQHRVENYSNPEERNQKVETKIAVSRQLKRKYGIID